jgi:hypothetical protein
VVAVGTPHHVTQRGNNRQRTFSSQQIYQVCLALLAERARQYECRLLGYCLMPNHVHLLVIPGRGDALALAPGRVPASPAPPKLLEHFVPRATVKSGMHRPHDRGGRLGAPGANSARSNPN